MKILKNKTIEMTEEQYDRNIAKIEQYLQENKIARRTLSRCINFGNNTISDMLTRRRMGCIEIWEQLEEVMGCKFEYKSVRDSEKSEKNKITLPDYIEKQLSVTKNTFISKKIVKKYGKKAIINELKKLGFNVILYKTEFDNYILEIKE